MRRISRTSPSPRVQAKLPPLSVPQLPDRRSRLFERLASGRGVAIGMAFALGLGLVVATPETAFAQDPGSPPSEVVLKAKKGGYKIQELFESIYKTTGRSILFEATNAQIKNTTVEFIGDHVIPEDRLFDWLQAVLSYHRLVLVPVGPGSESTGGKQQWFCMEQANPNLTSRPVYIDESEIDDYADRDGLYVVTSLTLKNISDTSRVRNALSNLSTKTAGIGRVMDVQGSRALIVGDFAPIVAAMKRLLSYIDTDNPTIQPQMEVVRLKNAVASELEPIISELIQQSQTTPQRQPRGQTTEDEPEPKLIADPRLQALIIYATESHRKQIRELIEALDIPATTGGDLHFRALKHTDAEQMADLLDELISGTGTVSTGRTNNRNTGRRSTPNTAGQPGSVFGGGTEGDPVILADTRSNSLIIHANRNQYESISELIEKLDQARPQVLIETALVELTLNDQLSLGVELFDATNTIGVDTTGDGNADSITNERAFFAAGLFGLTDPVTQAIGSGDSVVNVPTGRSPSLANGGINVGIFNNGQLLGMLRALQSSSRAKVLTMPSVVTNDNEEAVLTLTRQTSFRENVRDDTGDSRDTFREVEASTELRVSPHISSDNYLRLHLTQSVQNFTTPANALEGAPPDITSRDVDTNVTVPDGYTVIVGGLIQHSEGSSVSKVPILGDLPLLGILFRSTSDSSNPQHLFLFVTPHILRDVENFEDYLKLTYERKLLQDNLFGSEVVFPASNFHEPGTKMTARERVKRLQVSGELDAPRIKAPMSESERVEEARRAYHKGGDIGGGATDETASEGTESAGDGETDSKREDD